MKNFLLFVVAMVVAAAMGGCATLGVVDSGGVYRAENRVGSILATPRSPLALSFSRNQRNTDLFGAMSDSFTGHTMGQEALLGPAAEARSNTLVLAGNEPLVVVCISGGGSRADRFAAHALAILEEAYNKRLKESDSKPEVHIEGPKPSLVDHIDAFSTVSGGSIYAAYVANQLAANPSEKPTVFEKVRDCDSSRRMGAMAAEMYLNPFNFFLPLLNNVLTDRHYLDLLAFTTEINLRSQRPGKLPMLTPLRGTWMSLAELPARPLFLFNSTCGDTGLPFVISQVPLHSSGQTGFTAMDNFNRAIAPRKRTEGLPGVLPTRLLLEDIGTAPRGFTLADAAIASAAFPGYEPMLFTVYPTEANSVFTGGQERLIHLTDGGIFDNSGIDTALELYYSLRQAKPEREGQVQEHERQLILIYVDANTDIYRSYAQRLKKANDIPLALQFPLSGIPEAMTSTFEIHAINKLRAEQIFAQEIKPNGNPDPNISFYRIDISRLLLEPMEGEERRKQDELGAVPTDFAIGKHEDDLLKWAAQRALDGKKEDEDEHWSPGGKTRMEAILEDVLKRSHPPF
jgi:hypothetical protein